jgi:hypothetical protein
VVICKIDGRKVNLRTTDPTDSFGPLVVLKVTSTAPRQAMVAAALCACRALASCDAFLGWVNDHRP